MPPSDGEDVLNCVALFLVEGVFEPVAQAIYVTVFDDANEAARAVIDLVDEGYLLMVFDAGNFIDADGTNAIRLRLVRLYWAAHWTLRKTLSHCA